MIAYGCWPVGWDDFLVLSTSLTRDHRLRARRRCLAISNARRQTLRIGPYRDLLKVSRKMAGYTRTALAACEDSSHPRVVRVRSLLEHYLELTDRVIDQTERRVLRGESVPAGQKVVSIFEEHTDLIRKGGRETVYGHKVFLSCGSSSLILDCLPVRGNPADSTYLETMLDRHCHQYGLLSASGQLGRGLCIKSEFGLGQEQARPQGCGFRQKAWTHDRIDGLLQLGVQTAAPFSGRHRRLYLDAQARLRAGPMPLERLAALPAVPAALDAFLQSAGTGAPAIVEVLLRLTSRSGWQRAEVSLKIDSG